MPLVSRDTDESVLTPLPLTRRTVHVGGEYQIGVGAVKPWVWDTVAPFIECL